MEGSGGQPPSSGCLKQIIIGVIIGLIVLFFGWLSYNFFAVGSLEGKCLGHDSVQLNSKYKIICKFEIKNKGLLSVDSKTIQLNIGEDAKIESYNMPRGMDYQWEIAEGGPGDNIIVFLIDGLEKGGTIQGSISFIQNKPWYEKIRPCWFK
jgi:hypothetical protein